MEVKVPFVSTVLHKVQKVIDLSSDPMVSEITVLGSDGNDLIIGNELNNYISV